MQSATHVNSFPKRRCENLSNKNTPEEASSNNLWYFCSYLVFDLGAKTRVQRRIDLLNFFILNRTFPPLFSSASTDWASVLYYDWNMLLTWLILTNHFYTTPHFHGRETLVMYWRGFTDLGNPQVGHEPVAIATGLVPNCCFCCVFLLGLVYV